MLKPVDIIIPTMDNHKQLHECLTTISRTWVEYPHSIIVVNNSAEPLAINSATDREIKVVEAGKNLGWTGGLREGLKHSNSEYVMFANDDILIPCSSKGWLRTLMKDITTRDYIGAVGPSSNIVMGSQNIFSLADNIQRAYVPFLIGFCILVRREALDNAGGIQDMEYGGDDIDLSIRLKDAGYVLMCDRNVFVYHHGFQTGTRIHGTPDKKNGWNSREMTDNTNMELIRKHGFIKWWKTLVRHKKEDSGDYTVDLSDKEGEIVKKFMNGSEKVVELGCGFNKTIDNAIGVDIVPKGHQMPFMYYDKVSVADVCADVSEPLPKEIHGADCVIARHVLEHCLDVPQTLRYWKEVIKPGGRLIVALPNENYNDGILLNPDHKHAFTPESIRNIAELVGFKFIGEETKYNEQSFVSCYENMG